MFTEFKRIKKLISTVKKYIKSHVLSPLVKEIGVVEAYNIWASDYDTQPGNLMLHLDETVFNSLLSNVDIKGKQVADIGCGTGRHWPLLLKNEPANLKGFDVSAGMLQKLKHKFPGADVKIITGNNFLDIKDNSFDTIISTLTVAHIGNIEAALAAWVRTLKTEGDIIITDFHPTALASGGQRTFRHQGKYIAVKNNVHPIDYIKKLLLKYNFRLFNEHEIKVDETVKHYYEAQNALHVYEKFKGSPIIYGLHFRRLL